MDVTTLAASPARTFPLVIAQAGPRAEAGFLEFFAARIRNPNTRSAYARAVSAFCLWCEQRKLELPHVGPVDVAAYIELLGCELAPPSVKQHLAALRVFFDHLVLCHVLERNPAHGVRGPKHVVRRGSTPVLETTEARTLLDSISTDDPVGLRDHAIIATMLYTFARVSAVAGLDRGDYRPRGKRMRLHFREKGGKVHCVPCSTRLEEILEQYLDKGGLRNATVDTPLFRQARDPEQRLSRFDAYHMIRRRAQAANIPDVIGCHSFRATGITAFLQNGGAIEIAQALAAHESPTTTKLYDRRAEEIDFGEVERIKV